MGGDGGAGGGDGCGGGAFRAFGGKLSMDNFFFIVRLYFLLSFCVCLFDTCHNFYIHLNIYLFLVCHYIFKRYI